MFSLVVKPIIIQSILPIDVSLDWVLCQQDIKNAFLHGMLKETIFIEQPPISKSPQFPDHVYLLKKSLYGLKHTPWA